MALVIGRSDVEGLLDPARAMEVLEPVDGEVYPKHGSGCVLASALTANLALGYALPVAAGMAKEYTARFLGSNKTLLGWHECIF